MKNINASIAILAVASLGLVACGGSDDSGSEAQNRLADRALEMIEEFGDIEVDEDCLRDIVGDLSDDEADAGYEATLDDSDSEAFDAIGEEIEEECFA